jgi:hypothetical protein
MKFFQDSSQKYTWSDWSDWSVCPYNTKCGQITMRKRYRYCQTTNRMAQLQKVSVSLCESNDGFQSVEDQPCPMVQCNTPEWSPWGQWSACIDDCKKYRRRYCKQVDKLMDESLQDCVGDKQQSKQCNITECLPNTPNRIDVFHSKIKQLENHPSPSNINGILFFLFSFLSLIVFNFEY